MAKHRLLGWLNGYTKDDEGGKRFISKRISGSVASWRNNRLYVAANKGVKRASSTLACTSLRSIGVFLLSMGLFSLISSLAFGYSGGGEMDVVALVLSAAFSALGIILVPFDRPLCYALSEHILTDYIFFEFFGLKRMQKQEDAKGIHIAICFALGVGLGSLSLLFPLWMVIAVMGGLLYLFLSFASPEFSFFLSLLSLPYLVFINSEIIVICAMVAVSAVSFARKVVVGKRVLHIEQYDILIMIFMLLVLISGVFVKGVESFQGSLVMIALLSGYFLSTSIVTNRRLADRMASSVVVSSVPIAIFAIYQAVSLIAEKGIGSFRGVSGGFSVPADLAAFLLVAGIFSLYFVKSTKRTRVAVLYTAFFTVIVAALVATLCTWAIVAVLFGIIGYWLSKMRGISVGLLALLCLAPYALIFVPYSVLEPIAELPVISTLDLMSLTQRWRISLLMLRDNLLFGIGIGEDCFTHEFGQHTSEIYPNSGNLLLEIGVEVGAVALAVLLFVLAVLVRHRAAYRSYVKHSSVRNFTVFTGVIIVVLFVFGAVKYLWEEPVVGYIFWCVLGASTAALRVSKRDDDDRVGYLKDVRRIDASAIDIEIE